MRNYKVIVHNKDYEEGAEIKVTSGAKLYKIPEGQPIVVPEDVFSILKDAFYISYDKELKNPFEKHRYIVTVLESPDDKKIGRPKTKNAEPAIEPQPEPSTVTALDGSPVPVKDQDEDDDDASGNI